MSEFYELIKNFQKIRGYTREFFVYGFKSRNDFNIKSNRSYDNERRRLESYLGESLQSSYTNKGKYFYISIDTAKTQANPLYKIWKSKSFTDNDIMLHFYILDILKEKNNLTIEELTDVICERSSVIFESQIVRNKCKEYVENEILTVNKDGKKFLYSIAKNDIQLNTDSMYTALSYFQNDAPFGFVGNTILDKLSVRENVFAFKHLYIMNTLDDDILYKILIAIKENRKCVFFKNYSRGNNVETIESIPLKILISTQTGRHYVAVYNSKTKRFLTIKINNIKDVKHLGVVPDYNDIKNNLEKNLDKCWGVSFERNKKDASNSRNDYVKLTLNVNEQYEQYILTRLEIEGRGGVVEKIAENTFVYYKEVFDANEMMPWIKTFIGRIVSLESNNTYVVDKLYDDINRMFKMYDINEEG